jgi:poly-gamma-glutamate synthase PgsB/CapB
MPLLLLAALAILAALGVERVRLDRSRGKIPLRIAVTGTRGKTTVARLLASVLREDGRTVLAKTTGSEPCLILPDGAVEHIRRRGPASVLEQKALLHRAARLGADTVVAEVMSIHAENHEVEGRRILLPQVVLATNFLVDHVDAQGDTPESVGAVLGWSVPPGATVLVPRDRCPASFRAAAAGVGAAIVEVQEGAGGGFPPATLPENLDLVVAAARHLGVGDAAIHRGIARARHDIGALGVWRVAHEGSAPPAFLVNAFAANDPASTLRVMEDVSARLGAEAGNPDGTGSPDARLRRIGLLNLRADRGDRTVQWADALGAGFLDRFDALLVTGAHARALARRVLRANPEARIVAVGRSSADNLTRTALAELGEGGGMVFGFGNIGGAGVALVAHWARTGREAALGN